MKLLRDHQDAHRTYGTLLDDNDTVLVAQTIERPWLNNARGVSCIPAGTYTARLRFSPKHGCAVYGLLNVPERSDIEIHPANVAPQLNGCIALGRTRGRLNFADGTGEQDAVLQSVATMKMFMAARGVPVFLDLKSEAAVVGFLQANPAAATFELTICDPTS